YDSRRRRKGGSWRFPSGCPDPFRLEIPQYHVGRQLLHVAQFLQKPVQQTGVLILRLVLASLNIGNFSLYFFRVMIPIMGIALLCFGVPRIDAFGCISDFSVDFVRRISGAAPTILAAPFSFYVVVALFLFISARPSPAGKSIPWGNSR